MPEDSWYVAGAIAALVLCSFLTRAGYFLFGDHIPLSDRSRRALRFAPVAALTGIIIPELLPWQDGASALFDPRMLAAVIAGLVYWRTQNTVMVIVGGMVAFWVLRWAFVGN